MSADSKNSPIEDFAGPDTLYEALLDAREENSPNAASSGNISDAGLYKLLLLAYYTSQATNEGRYPKFVLFVPAAGEAVELVATLDERLTGPLIRRLAPTVSFQDHAILVSESDDGLLVKGIIATNSLLTKLDFGDPIATPSPRPNGLTLEVSGPGELAASEHWSFQLRAGTLTPTISILFADWFHEWHEEAASRLFGLKSEDETRFPGYLLGKVWLRILKRASEFKHGGCFVLTRSTTHLPIRPVFEAKCDLGAVVRSYLVSLEGTDPDAETVSSDIARSRLLLRDKLLSTIEALARLSATDGCVIFNRELQLYSFGSIILGNEGGEKSKSIPCLTGHPPKEIGAETVRTFGARRQSALRLCQACPGTLAFVISQDGDLRVFASNEQGFETERNFEKKRQVRLYDDLTYL